MNKLQHREAVVAVARRLLATPTDEIVSLEQLSEAAGCDIVQYRWILASAFKAVNADFGAIFATVRKQGYRRLDRATGTLFAGARGLHRIRRASRSALKLATNAAKHANDMTAEQRRRHNQQMASLGLISHLTMVRTIETMPEGQPKQADPLAGLKEALGV